MMHRTVLPLLLTLSLLPAPAPADTCDEQARARPGGWVVGSDAGGSGSPATARHKTRIQPLLDQLAAVVRDAYPEPVGSQGKLYRNYGLESFAGDELATYELVANFKGYGCNRITSPAGEIELMGETATWLYVQVNSFWPGSSRLEYPQHFLSSQDHQNLYTLQPPRVLRTPQPGAAGRRPIDATLPPAIAALPNFVFEGAYDSTDTSYNTREVAQVVFLTPDGRIPYDPVTIGEFLDVNQARLEAFIRDNEAYGGVESYQELLGRIPALRTRYAGRLGETAYIRSFSWSESELAQPEPFTGESGYMLARRTRRYATAGDAWSPRFITVFWRWQPEVEYSVRFHEAIKRKLDLDRLAALLVRPAAGPSPSAQSR